MLIKNCLSCAAKYLDIENMLIEDAAIAEDARLRKLLHAFNMAVSEIMQEYAPHTINEQVNAAEGKIFYESLSRTPVKIYSVKINGIGVKIKEKPAFAEIEGNGKATVEYAYSLPVAVSVNEEIQLLPYLTERIIAIATAAEYSALENRYESALLFTNKLKQSLKEASRKHAHLPLPERRM